MTTQGYLFWNDKRKLDGQYEFATCSVCGGFGPSVKEGHTVLSQVVCFNCNQEQIPKESGRRRWGTPKYTVRKHKHKDIDSLDAALKKSNELTGNNVELTFPV